MKRLFVCAGTTLLAANAHVALDVFDTADTDHDGRMDRNHGGALAREDFRSASRHRVARVSTECAQAAARGIILRQIFLPARL
jgi:hypothetical protein